MGCCQLAYIGVLAVNEVRVVVRVVLAVLVESAGTRLD